MSAADDLAALHHQVSLASSASDHDLAFHLQLSVAIHASLLLQQPSNAAAPAPPEEPSDASCALAVHAADLARRPGPGRCLTPRHRARRPLRARPRRHPGGTLGPRRRLLRAAPGRRPRRRRRAGRWWARVSATPASPSAGHGGRWCSGYTSPCRRMTLEAMALVEGLNAALGLGIRTLNVLTDNKPLHNHTAGILRPRQKRLVDMINEALSVKQKFEQCEILFVARSQVNYVTKLATDTLQTQIAKAAAVSAGKEKRENCTICLEDTDVSKIHAVEGCAHRFCFSCMKEHVKVKLLHGMLPACHKMVALPR
uniref:RING-type domain-containing protein n=1 Tax=Oryza punctata TaxID=4537 RepID=A0A0E0MIM2_ORYPU